MKVVAGSSLTFKDNKGLLNTQWSLPHTQGSIYADQKGISQVAADVRRGPADSLNVCCCCSGSPRLRAPGAPATSHSAKFCSLVAVRTNHDTQQTHVEVY